MSGLTWADVAENLVLKCVLCGAEMPIDELNGHAAEHVMVGEGWSYRSFAGACALDDTLEGWPVATPDGDEQLCPFWVVTNALAALQGRLRDTAPAARQGVA